MRRQYFAWTYLVLAIVLTAYSGYSIIYNINHQKDVPVLGIVFLTIGGAMLVLFLILFIISAFQKKKTPVMDVTNEPEKVEEKVEEVVVEKKEEEEPALEEKPLPKTYQKDVTYQSNRTISRSYGGSAYIKKVGYGPVLRVEEDEILDMRSNTYYRIDGNIVKRSGSGPVYEISGNRIRSAFGSYLFEISGGSVYKTFGGFYASISGGYLQTYDLAEKYEISGSLSIKQQLAVVALLFEAQ